jgi:copper homeostasis protein
VTASYPNVLLEVCVGSVTDVLAATAAGANRVELCGGLELGGLTPSLGLVESVLAVSTVPVVVMLRPRTGGFHYDRHEFAVMCRDAQLFLGLGVQGIVFGLLDENGNVDSSRSRELVQLADRRDAVFHRAFDFVGNQIEALDTLSEIGCKRILTSGGKSSASEGAGAIRNLARHAAGRVEVLPGGGINAKNVIELVRATGCRQLHIGASSPCDDGSIANGSSIQLCDVRFSQGFAHRQVVGELVGDVAQALRRHGARC